MKKHELPDTITGFVETWQRKGYALVSLSVRTCELAEGMTSYRALLVDRENVFDTEDMRCMVVLDQTLDADGVTLSRDVMHGAISDFEELTEKARAFGMECRLYKDAEGATA